MEEIMKDINHAFRAISSILVAGDAVDAVAVARAKLQEASAKCEEKLRKERESEKTPDKED